MGKIKNTVVPNKINMDNIPDNIRETYSYNKNKTIIDFSFPGAFISCECGKFNNYLKDKDNYIDKFRKLMCEVKNLSDFTLYELINNGRSRHCHQVPKEDENKASNIIKEIFNVINENNKDAFDQEIGAESIYQLGLQSEIRIFGTIKGNVFRVYFIDYFHDFNFDQRRNERNKKHCKFCAINTEL